jgi:hypothetical protein
MGNVPACHANGSITDAGAIGLEISTFRMASPVRYPLLC